jgi:hypothetical protein
MSGGIARMSLVIAAVLAVASSAAASPKFNGNVCALLTTQQVTAITGVSAKCNNQPPLPGMGGKTYVGDWASLLPKGPTLQVTVSVFSDPVWLAKAIHNLMQGLNGPPKKVTGIGTAAYEATGAYAVGIHTYVGKNLIYISLNEVGKTPSSPALIAPVAKDVVARLS